MSGRAKELEGMAALTQRRNYTKQVVTVGRIVHYYLTDNEIVPMIVVKTFANDEVSGQAFIHDEQGTFFVSSAHPGSKAGQWEWPPRV